MYFDLTAQKALWSAYRSLPSIKPARLTFEEYDELAALREIFVGLSMLLASRKDFLARLRLKSQVDATIPSLYTQLFMSATTRLLIRNIALFKETTQTLVPPR